MQLFVIQEEPLAESRVFDPAGGSGAELVFYGRVREHGPLGSGVEAIEYSCYSELARREGEAILAEARQRFSLHSVHCAHRIGRLALTEASIRVEIWAAHRREAFEACAYIMNQVKERLPIWKKEFLSQSGSGAAGQWQ